MKAQFLGTGTSQGVPVIGCHCEVCESSDVKDKRLRTSLALAYNGGHLIVDVGPDFRQQMLRAKVEYLHGILLTHEHNDHIAGLDDIRPFNFKQGGALKIFALKRVAQDLRKRFEYVFSSDKYPGAPKVDLVEIEPYQELDIGGLSVLPIDIRHGSLPILGYRMGGLCYITDANQLPDRTKQVISDTKVLVLNALHHRQHHSHFNLVQALSLAQELKVPETYFVHMSHKMGKHAHVSAGLPEGISLAFDGLEINIT